MTSIFSTAFPKMSNEDLEYRIVEVIPDLRERNESLITNLQVSSPPTELFGF